MIVGIGIDVSMPERFSSWSLYGFAQLCKIFSEYELIECFGSQDDLIIKDCFASSPDRVCEFLSSRFAAKEAFYKALSNALIMLGLTQQTISFAVTRSSVQVVKGVWDVPFLDIDWKALEQKIDAKLPPLQAHFSFSHEKNVATAIVMLCKI